VRLATPWGRRDADAGHVGGRRDRDHRRRSRGGVNLNVRQVIVAAPLVIAPHGDRRDSERRGRSDRLRALGTCSQAHITAQAAGGRFRRWNSAALRRLFLATSIGRGVVLWRER